jgi:hypothetical protein
MADNVNVMDDAAFSASLSPEQKTFFESHVTRVKESAVTEFKTADQAARQKAVPEKYELKFSEQSPLDKAADAEKIAAFAKKHGLTQEQAQELAAETEARAQAVIERQQAFLKSEGARWKSEVEADKDLGGKNLTQTIANTKRVMDRFAPEGSPMRSLLNETGYGNHPEFVRFVNAIGKAMAEDSPSILGGTGPGSMKEFDPRQLYNKSNMA